MNKKLFPLISAAVVTAAVPAYANSRHHTAKSSSGDDTNAWTSHYFTMVDTDHDGMITRDEFMSHARTKFDQMDTNHDGTISKDEMMSFKRSEWKDYGPHGKRTRPNSENLPEANDGQRPVVSDETKSTTENGQ